MPTSKEDEIYKLGRNFFDHLLRSMNMNERERREREWEREFWWTLASGAVALFLLSMAFGFLFGRGEI